MFRALSSTPPVWRTLGAAAAILALMPLSGCGRDDPLPVPPGVQTGLHLACQTVECECRQREEGLFGSTKTAEILWKENGDAYCPQGYTLTRVELDILGRKK